MDGKKCDITSNEMSANPGRSFYGKINEYVPGDCFASHKEMADEFFFYH